MRPEHGQLGGRLPLSKDDIALPSRARNFVVREKDLRRCEGGLSEAGKNLSHLVNLGLSFKITAFAGRFSATAHS
jgi:hypothetical protein